MPKVLISDSMSKVAQKIFEKNKISVEVKIGLPEEEIIKIITFPKNYASPKTCRYLRIVDNGIVLV